MTPRRFLPGSIRGAIMAVAGMVPLIVLVTLGPIAQDPAYHQFADTRSLAGLPNAWNVLSNLPLLVVGIAGLVAVRGRRRAQPPAVWLPYATFYSGLVLTSFGSAWYHLAPDNDSLVWDRLPMTIAFMGFFCSVVAETAGRRAAHWLLPALLVAGIGSVLYWQAGEQQGAGDLRPYALVQFLPMLLIPLLLVLYPRPPGYLPQVLTVLSLYAASKVFEHLDRELYAVGEVVSGHTLKHLAAAAAAAGLLPWLWRHGRMSSADGGSRT